MLTRQSTLYREPPEPGARFVAIRLILTCLLLGTLVLGAQVLGTLALVSPAFAQTGAAKKANVKKADADTDSSAESSDPAALPPGYIPPREVRPEFTTEKELNFNPFKDDRDRAAKMLKFNSLKITGELKEEDKKLVSDIVRWRLAEMTKKENRATVHKIRDDLNRDLRQAGISKKRGMQEALVQSIIQYAPELFDYHIVARMNAAVLLAELNEVEEDYFSGRPAVPARDAAAPLLKLLADHQQLEAVRIWAIKGLARIASIKDLRGEVKQPILTLMADEMNKSHTSHPWYQMRLAEGLGMLNALYDRNKDPIVSKALETVLVDTKRPWIVRCEAAQSLGRLPLDRSNNVTRIAVDIVRLAQQMTLEYQKQPKDSQWNACFFKLYLAFKPANDVEKSQGAGLLSQVQSKAILSAHKKPVQDAYAQILPLVEAILKDSQAGIPAALAGITEWLKSQPKTAGDGPAAAIPTDARVGSVR